MKFSSNCISLPYYRYFSLSGDKALAFLQGQLSCDVNRISDTQAVFGAYLNIKGRVITTLRLLKIDGKLLLQLPESLADIVVSRLARVAMLSRVTLTPEPELTTLGIIGEDTIPALGMDVIPQVTMSITQSNPDSALVRIAQAELFMLIGSKKSMTPFLKDPSPVDQNVWLYQLIQSRLVEIDTQTTEQFTPHELDLSAHEAVSFTKGCYVGQEIVARMQYLGKLKQHLQQLQWHIPPLRSNNAPLYDQEQKIVGYTVMICNVENEQYALAVIRDGAKLNGGITNENN